PQWPQLPHECVEQLPQLWPPPCAWSLPPPRSKLFVGLVVAKLETFLLTFFPWQNSQVMLLRSVFIEHKTSNALLQSEQKNS
ncbi:MAG TPA: hypothetical protein PLP29_17355, partial [Candidatus Ozemobacteraceae bacterium]|nr:hypothetical protein [Candidatus Ozemobacteraceae bacterium]